MRDRGWTAKYIYLAVDEAFGIVGEQQRSQRPAHALHGRAGRLGDGQRRIRMVGTERSAGGRGGSGRDPGAVA